MRQLGLNIQLKDWAIFESYFPGSNEQTVAYLESLVSQEATVVWLWGDPAVGKTHLLQAACVSYDEKGAVYIPCADVTADIRPELLTGLGDLGLVCLDDLHAVVEDEAWEAAIFRLFNELQELGGKIVVSSQCPPAELPFNLADVASRLSWGPVFRIKSLTDEQRGGALRQRARIRGLKLSEETSTFLLRHYSRDTGQLFELLDQLDAASIEAKRRLTIPFVKSVLKGL